MTVGQGIRLKSMSVSEVLEVNFTSFALKSLHCSKGAPQTLAVNVFFIKAVAILNNTRYACGLEIRKTY